MSDFLVSIQNANAKQFTDLSPAVPTIAEMVTETGISAFPTLTILSIVEVITLWHCACNWVKPDSQYLEQDKILYSAQKSYLVVKIA